MKKKEDWFREARFGLFIHWGIYAILAAGEWIYANCEWKNGEYLGKRLLMEICRRTSIAPIFGNVLSFRDYHGHFPDYYSGQYPVKRFVIEPFFSVFEMTTNDSIPCNF